jgi:hypothetical protein
MQPARVTAWSASLCYLLQEEEYKSQSGRAVVCANSESRPCPPILRCYVSDCEDFGALPSDEIALPGSKMSFSHESATSTRSPGILVACAHRS